MCVWYIDGVDYWNPQHHSTFYFQPAQIRLSQYQSIFLQTRVIKCSGRSTVSQNIAIDQHRNMLFKYYVTFFYKFDIRHPLAMLRNAKQHTPTVPALRHTSIIPWLEKLNRSLLRIWISVLSRVQNRYTYKCTLYICEKIEKNTVIGYTFHKKYIKSCKKMH